MNLENLVPPLELCKLIPAGEFADSVHWYRWSYIDQKYLVVEGKPDVRLHRDPCPCGMKYFYPAPTLQEIIDVLPQGVELYKDSEYFCSLSMSNEYYGETAVIAALKVWLKLKGIEYEQKQS